MKRLLFSLLLTLNFACDDGDLQIETLDFDNSTIQVCEPVAVDVANVMFKLNSTEALILELPSGTIKNEVTSERLESSVGASGPSKVTYRTFSDNVSNSYFCSEIPLTTPTVVDEVIAQGGKVFITSVLSADGNSYEHTIELSEISLVTSEDNRITDLSINNFGKVSTTVQ
jgi:hypothetical protein